MELICSIEVYDILRIKVMPFGVISYPDIKGRIRIVSAASGKILPHNEDFNHRYLFPLTNFGGWGVWEWTLTVVRNLIIAYDIRAQELGYK